MEVAGELIISLLKLTKGKPVSHELVKDDAKLPSTVVNRLLRSLQSDGLIYVRSRFIETNALQRLKLGVRALQLGVDYERVSGFLEWKEFESMATVVFEAYGYRVRTNLRFKQGGRRWEIDVVGCRKPLVVCADCKHWRRGFYPSTLKRVVEEQVSRTLALSESLPNPSVKVECASWSEAKFLPMVLSLMPVRSKFHDGTPVVPILQLQDFLTHLPMCIDSLKHFGKTHSRFKIVS